jgi:hypothetical protein
MPQAAKYERRRDDECESRQHFARLVTYVIEGVVFQRKVSDHVDCVMRQGSRPGDDCNEQRDQQTRDCAHGTPGSRPREDQPFSQVCEAFESAKR